MRTYDADIQRMTNKQLHQLVKNIFEKNNFSSIGIVESDPVNRQCRIKIVPTISYSVFERQDGYTKVDPRNPIVDALVPLGMTIKKGNIVLVIFTDNDFRKTFNELRAGKSKDSQFIEVNKTKNDLNYAIITNVLL